LGTEPPCRLTRRARAFERLERGSEARVGAHLARVDLAEHLELRIEAGGGRMPSKDLRAQTVDGADLRRAEIPTLAPPHGRGRRCTDQLGLQGGGLIGS